MKRRRGIKMTPPPTSLCFIVLVTTMCFVCTAAQSTDAEQSSAEAVFTETTVEASTVPRGNKKLGDRCNDTTECGFDGAICAGNKKTTCQCLQDLPATNHIDKCGKTAIINESCFFNEQCEMVNYQTECRDGHCMCRFEMTPVTKKDGTIECTATVPRGNKKLGDRCNDTTECGFDGAICAGDKKATCQCLQDLPATNHIDKCGKTAIINESCFFNEQCEMANYQTECRDGHCMCRFEMTPVTKKDGTIECTVKNEDTTPTRYVDPTMIGVLVGMALMFIILCVVLRLFSKARWRENRTIFNTPNPRLMNVSLLRDSKLLHGPERRGSRASVRGPSRQPSMASLRPQSPQSIGSRRGSHASSNASVTSNKSQKSPTKATSPNSTAVPNHTESVTVEIQEPKM